MISGVTKVLLACLLFGLLFFCFSRTSFAETTSYKSATNITTDGVPGYTNLGNCSSTDGLTCDRALNAGYGNLYFRDFGDFEIPDGATITQIKIRITGKTQTPSLALFPALSRIGTGGNSVFYESCQSPSDFWRAYALNSSSIRIYEVTTPLTNGYLKDCLTLSNIRTNNFIFQLHYSNANSWSANIDNFEIAFEYTNAPTPTPSPSVTPSPTPAPPAPFLDLPWDYESKGLTFNEAALNINTFFDHEYPLLSSGFNEPFIAQNNLTNYEGRFRTKLEYSSHDGYDYGRRAKANYGDSVLAAAAGTARFVNTCGPCGDAIYIDHGNGYQTRYYHLQPEGLITNDPSQRIIVEKDIPIGKVGATGNVRPVGEDGAHIHFMVVRDKNSDGNFDDNIPDGIVDPFGWQWQEPDPWENYSFFYNGMQRTGSKSYYLWNKNIDNLKLELTSNGGVFNSGKTKLTFPENSTSQNILILILSTPAKELTNLISSLGSTVQILANDSQGNKINVFNNPFNLEIDFSNQDLSRFLVDTLSIYSSSDGIDWVKEPTSVDFQNQKATSSINHLTYFALMAERKDTIPATTSATLIGVQGDSSWFRSNVDIALNAEDNLNGLGVDYILYRKDEGGWERYEGPIKFSDEGKHRLEYYSVDNDENIEEKKILEFSIDKTPPEVEIYYSIAAKNVEFYGRDGSESASVVKSNEGGIKKIVVVDKAGNTLTILAKNFNSAFLSWINVLSIQYNDDFPIVLAKNNLLLTPFYNKANQLTSVGEIYSVKDKNLLGIIYALATDKTKIYTYDRQNKQILKEEAPGMHLLKLFTESATLKYSY